MYRVYGLALRPAAAVRRPVSRAYPGVFERDSKPAVAGGKGHRGFFGHGGEKVALSTMRRMVVCFQPYVHGVRVCLSGAVGKK